MTNSTASSFPNFTSTTSMTRFTCPNTLERVLYLGIVGVFAAVGNIFLGYAVYVEWKRKKTPDKILIFNLVAANLATLMISLPMEAVLVIDFEHYINCSRAQTILLFDVTFDLKIICNFATLATLALIAFDRFEALTKFPHQRKLTIKLACILALVVWVAASAIVTAMSVGPLQYYCILLSEDKGMNTTVLTVRIAVISVWTTICCTIVSIVFHVAASHIKTHRAEMHQMFGHRETAENISFTFSSIALSVAFIVAWVPYGVAVAVLNQRANTVSKMCLELWIQTLTYVSSGLAPLIYLFMDRRLKNNIKRIRKRFSSLETNSDCSTSSMTLNERYRITQPNQLELVKFKGKLTPVCS